MNLIENSIIKIQPFNDEHLDEFVVAVRESAATVGKWMSWCHKEYSISEARLWFESCQKNINKQSAYDLGIFSKEHNQLLGSIAINRIDHEHKMGNIGYWVRETFQNQGIASSAVQLIKEFGFNELGLNRLEIVVLEDNLFSRKVAEGSGAQFEWIAKNRLMHHQQTRIAVIYSLTPCD